MSKKVFVGGLHHESDTFNPIITGEKDIWVRRGQELFTSEREDSASGIIAQLEKAGCTVVPSLIARAVPNGVWDRDYYVSLRDELLSDLQKAMPVDGICLSLHGSMRVDQIGEAEGDLLQRVRAIAPDVPLYAALDMHATITKKMLDNADGFVGYKCAPHTDTFETGEHAARMLLDALESGCRHHMSAIHIPMLIAGEQSETSVEPMKSLMAELRESEREEGVVACSYLLGFPWADVYENGVTVLVVARSAEKANSTAETLCERFWTRRHDFRFYNETHEMDECLEKTKESLEEGIYPVVISDSGDNPTAGSSQDVTNFLKLILKDSVLSQLDPPLVYQGFYDPHIVDEAFKAGVGGRVKGPLGAYFDKEKSSPIEIDATVKALRKGWEGANGVDLALLDVCGLDVVVTSMHVGCYDPEMMRVLGVVPEERKVIIVKLGYLEPEIRKIAKRSMMALSDGSTNEIFSRLPYKKLRHPVFPLDGDDAPYKTEFVLEA